MKQVIADYIDQLDLALDQIAYNDRNFDRFSILLIDNVMELFLSQYANDCSHYNSMWSKIGKEKYSSKLLLRALGNHFNDKVKFAIDTNFIDKNVGETLIYLHKFRNSAYHEGKRHEGILHSLTILYFKLTCQIISKYEPIYFSVSSKDNISHRAMKYLGDDNFPFDGKSWLKSFVRLEQVVNRFEENLLIDLLFDLNSIIESVNNDIDFIVNESPKTMTRLDAIIECQSWHYAFEKDLEKFASDKIDLEKINVFDLVEWTKEYYPKIYKYDPINNWEKVLSKLKNTSDYLIALKIYCDFLSENYNLINSIDEAALKLNITISNNIDSIRGK